MGHAVDAELAAEVVATRVEFENIVVLRVFA